MTNSGGNSTLILNGLLTSDRAIFVVVSATIIGVLVETGIIRVSGFVGVRDLSLDIAIFVGLGIFCVFSQLMILNFVRNKIGRSFLSHNRIGLLNKAIVLIQLGIIALLVLVFLEVSLTSSYHTILIRTVIMSSFLTASALTALLSWRFIVWIRSNKN